MIPSTLARAAAAVLLVTVSGVSLRRFISSRLGSRSNRVYPPLREPFLVACDGMKLGLEIVGYLRDASGPRKLVINSNIIHDSHGRSRGTQGLDGYQMGYRWGSDGCQMGIRWVSAMVAVEAPRG